MHSFKWLANQVGYKFIARVAIELERKQNLVLGLRPWTRFVYCHESLAPAISITYIVDYNNNIIIVPQYN